MAWRYGGQLATFPQKLALILLMVSEKTCLQMDGHQYLGISFADTVKQS